eukprot:519198-Pelagomonas_calceolata.AAC.1
MMQSLTLPPRELLEGAAEGDEASLRCSSKLLALDRHACLHAAAGEDKWQHTRGGPLLEELTSRIQA